MTRQEQRQNAKNFAKEWQGRGDEKSETHNFWIGLLRTVFGVADSENKIEFEKRVQLDHTSFIDAYIESTSVLIEQKSIDIDLRKAYKQSDGIFLTPFQQAHRYAAKLPRSEFPRWIIVCNFKSFLVYDMERPNSEPVELLLERLEKDYYLLSFLVEKKNVHLQKEMGLSIKAGEIVGLIYDALLRQYKNPDSEKTLKSLNMLCVRLVFCLYAEDAGIFNKKKQFHDFLESYSVENIRQGLINLFKVLDTEEEKRDTELEDKLLAFPYVNGGLFSEEDLSIPQFSEELKRLLVEEASANFDWSEISPTIFGAVFESTLNPETRRTGGMHYTSIENIHKVISPLFLEELEQEFEKLKALKQVNVRTKKIIDFQKKLGSLKFLDPACGSGNFLTESYLCLRRLENKCLRVRFQEQNALDVLDDAIFVSIHQFYGIEINDFACAVAKTALWIAESQMMTETSKILSRNLEFLPLKSYSNIIEGNALKIDWKSLTVQGERKEPCTDTSKTDSTQEGIAKPFDYIMGNPPFVGARLMNEEQKAELFAVSGNTKNIGNLDYVGAWYKKSAALMKGTHTRAALVSTNSICQGEQTAILWKPLFEEGVHIDFAYQTFRWDSESACKAHVHCVIVGFSFAERRGAKTIFLSNEHTMEANNINAYLVDAPNIFIESRSTPLCDVPEMVFGSMPNDGGSFILSEDEKDELIKKEPKTKKYIRLFLGADEFINNTKRYCLWLEGASPSDIKNSPSILQRVKNVRELRANSKRSATRRLADTPALFGEIRQPKKGNYLLVPRVSSERRKYIPIGFFDASVIASDATQIVPDATLYHFGILTSNVHMAWMRAVCGRLEMRYRYSKNIVYNNFPWPAASEEQKQKIEATAKGILEARTCYPDSSLADLYDEITMPADLRKAHRENDMAVMKLYGFDYKTMSENECVAELFKLYEKLLSF